MVTGNSGAWGKIKRTGFSRENRNSGTTGSKSWPLAPRPCNQMMVVSGLSPVSICRVFRAVIGPPDIRERPATLTFSASASPKILSSTLPKLSELRRRRRIRCKQFQGLTSLAHTLHGAGVGYRRGCRVAENLPRLGQYVPVQVLASVDHGEERSQFLVTQLFVFHKLP